MSKHTSARVMTTSNPAQAQNLPPHLEQAVAVLFSTFNENESLDASTLMLAMAMLIMKAMQNHPSHDSWHLAQLAAEGDMKRAGVPQDKINAAFAALAKLSQSAENSSVWPKGFF